MCIFKLTDRYTDENLPICICKVTDRYTDENLPMCICKVTGRYTDENLPSSGQYQFILLPLTNTGQGIFTLATLETFYQKASTV